MEHYCETHKVPFTKKTGKYGDFWSHKLEDGSYCNEPKEKPEENKGKGAETEKAIAKPVEIKSFQRGSPEERNSIEEQVAFKGLIELMVGKIIDSKSPLFQTALNYAVSKLSKWSSMGDLEDDFLPIEESISAEEVIEDLKLIISSKKMTRPDVVKTLKANSATGDSISAMVKSLSPEGLAKFWAKLKPLIPSKLIQEAKKLGAEEIDPDDIPY